MRPYRAYLQCEVFPGMFPGEKAVQVYDKHGMLLTSGFFDESYVKDNGLEVIVIGEEGDEVLVKQSAVGEGGQGFFGGRSIQVPKSSISCDPALNRS